jgi:hypothetical protein
VIPPRLLRAYRGTEYRACGVVVRIGRRSPLTGVFITAWNPHSRRMPEGLNRRMQLRLQERLRRFSVCAADGVLNRWHEAHLLVAADPRRMSRIARQYRQCAIVVVQRGHPARLVLLQ